MNIAALINVTFRPVLTYWLIIANTAVSFAWSVKSASMYMSPLMPEEYKGLALYPVFLFYVFLGLFILHMTIE